jgi:hypothetical protein
VSVLLFGLEDFGQSRCRMSHTFDGKSLTKETAAFQLCDILDPMLKGMIEDPDAVRETCNVRSNFPLFFLSLLLKSK